MSRPIYLDYHATTPVDPRVFEAMRPYFTEKFGNASSKNHAFGWEAEEAVERARAQAAALIGARDPGEIYFTSGASESDNLAIQGVLTPERTHIVTTAIEHPAVLETARALAEEGRATLTIVPVERNGIVDPARVAEAMTDRTAVVSVMHANNEIGTIQPIAEIGAICRERGVLFHVDAAQSVGKIPVDVEAMGVDLLSLTAHKMYGPKGVGALYVRRRRPRIRIRPILHGGGQERGLRSGTLPVPLIVGFGEACAIAQREMEAEAARLRTLRERLWNALRAELDFLHLNGDPERRLPGSLNISFAYAEGEALILRIRPIAVSSGAACASASGKGSHVLQAIGLREDLIHSTIRFGLGRFTTEEEVDTAARRVVEAVRALREMSPAYSDAVRGILMPKEVKS